MHWLHTQSRPDNNASSEANRRTRGRVRLEGVESSLGPVLDISASGARVLSDRQHQGTVPLEIRTFEEAVTLSAEVVWCRKIAHRQFMIGLHLLQMTAENQRMLGGIASSHRPREAA